MKTDNITLDNKVAESRSELRRRSNPERDRGEVALVAQICDKGEGDRDFFFFSRPEQFI